MHPYLASVALDHPQSDWSYSVERGIEVLYFRQTRRAGVARGRTVVWLTSPSSAAARAFVERRSSV